MRTEIFCPLCFYQNWRCFNISKQEVLINEKIRCDELRVIGTDGAQLGIMSSDAALKLAFEQNLDLVLGVGEAKIEGDLLGESEVDCGVGELTLTLGKQTDYQVHLEKGLGSIFVNGSEYGGGVYGNGNNKVEIDGGVGRINVKFLADGVNL